MTVQAKSMADQLPAITVWQPWATLIAVGAKPFEFRGWPAPQHYRGQRIAIHAGARPVRTAEVRDLLLQLQSSVWRDTGLRREISIKLLERTLLNPRGLPLSSVICTAILGEPIRDADLAVELGVTILIDSDRGEHSSWGWPLTDISAVRPFAPARGKQGFWQWTVPS
jgi:hypothetical protein